MNLSSDDINGKELFLWENSAPGSDKLTFTEIVEEDASDNNYRERVFTSILKPSIIPMFPENPNGTAVVICPGGGYQKVVIDKEGFEAGRWLNNLGITVFILKYRLPCEGHDNRYLVPLQDAQRAVKIIKSKAGEWKINPQKIGIMGFSAGGHLASTLSTKYSFSTYESADEIDRLDARINFQILVYPVITMNPAIGHQGSTENLLGENSMGKLKEDFSNELQVTSDTPEAFIIHADDDNSVPSENSILFYQSLKRMKINAELHIFRNGGHGFGLRKADSPIGIWPYLCGIWLKSIGMA
jgi:acetyl esterase/lipase